MDFVIQLLAYDGNSRIISTHVEPRDYLKRITDNAVLCVTVNFTNFAFWINVRI